MLEHALCVSDTLEDYGEQLLSDIAEADFCLRPAVGINHPAWIIGHLAYSADRHGMFVGLDHRLGDWREAFRSGSVIVDDPTAYPSKDDLVAAWRAANERLRDGIRRASAEALGSVNEYHRPDLMPTVGDFLAYSLTGHTALHLGQLSAWRRAAGRSPLF